MLAVSLISFPLYTGNSNFQLLFSSVDVVLFFTARPCGGNVSKFLQRVLLSSSIVIARASLLSGVDALKKRSTIQKGAN